MKKLLVIISLLFALPLSGISNDVAQESIKDKIKKISKVELIGGAITAALMTIIGCRIAQIQDTKKLYDYSLASKKDSFNNGAMLSDDKRNEYFGKSITLRDQARWLSATLAMTLVSFGFFAGRASSQILSSQGTQEVNPKTS